MPANRLIQEKSPYLLQHANNPVDWFPWGEEAFKKAQKENKPVFLSIGYSTCHWCHVMEKESFEDKDVAALMNRSFISVKVDREERPDIDGIYMSVCQLLTGSGGWPLTIIMTPDKKPFFAGTYFPKENRFGRSGIVDLIIKIDEIWKTRKEDILKSADEITNAIQRNPAAEGQVELSSDLADKTFSELNKRYDSLHGGFGNAPKFPTPHNLLFLLRYWQRTKNPDALTMVEKTLSEMRKGGIYDHLGFGYHRYSTDRKWLVPHFEKMLYDQALLIPVYLETFQASGDSFYKETADEIFTYILRDMTSPEGVFYSAEDADSEGIEGKFYLWKEDELKNILNDADLFIKIFNVTAEGNWVDPVHGGPDSTNILHMEEDYAAIAEDIGLSVSALKEKIKQWSIQLFNEREKRIHPYKDDKILTDWNGLMISAFAKGYQLTGNTEYLNAAERAAEFILNKMRDGKKLLHRYREGEAALPAHLDDYAFFTAALLDLYESGFNVKYLKEALGFTELLIDEFKDTTSGGFFFTSREGEDLIARQKDIYDGAIPSGNSVSILNLLRLARLTGSTYFEKEAMDTAQVFTSSLISSPAAYTQAVSSLEFVFGTSFEIIITGSIDSEETKAILKVLYGMYLPNKVVHVAAYDDAVLIKLAPYLENYIQDGKKTAVYVCRNYQCSLPVYNAEDMIAELMK